MKRFIFILSLLLLFSVPSFALVVNGESKKYAIPNSSTTVNVPVGSFWEVIAVDCKVYFDPDGGAATNTDIPIEAGGSYEPKTAGLFQRIPANSNRFLISDSGTANIIIRYYY